MADSKTSNRTLLIGAVGVAGLLAGGVYLVMRMQTGRMQTGITQPPSGTQPPSQQPPSQQPPLPPPPPQPPGPAMNIRVSNVTPNSLVLSWDPVPGATSYTVMHTDENGNQAPDNFTVVVGGQRGNVFKVTGTSVQVEGLAPGSPIHFRVQACN